MDCEDAFINLLNGDAESITVYRKIGDEWFNKGELTTAKNLESKIIQSVIKLIEDKLENEAENTSEHNRQFIGFCEACTEILDVLEDWEENGIWIQYK